MPDEIPMPRGDLLAIRRLLWDVASEETTRHDLMVECYHWATTLDYEAGMPPWPTPGDPTTKVIDYYEEVRRHLDERIQALRDSQSEETD